MECIFQHLSLYQMVRKKLWPACLPDIDWDYMRETTYVAGWGITKNKYIQVIYVKNNQESLDFKIREQR